jgi:glycine/D-amino acid oxidase-like deaminating enzyme
VPSAVIVGAGIFGASLANRLTADGWDVTLVERDEPAGPRSTSGAHSRILRCVHGPDGWHAQMARRARELWRELEEESGEELLVESGVLWLARGDDGWEAAGERVLRELDIPVARLDPLEAAAFFPSFDPAGVAFAVHEPEAGALRARRAVEALVRLATDRGAALVRGEATPDGHAALVGEQRLEADHVIWACGPWLARLFPEHAQLRIDRVEYANFECGPEWSAENGVPTWAEIDADAYGIPSLDGQGFKVAPGGPPSPYDPDDERRELTANAESAARAYLARRFPSLAPARRVGGRVCQYEMTADEEFIVAPHPDHPSVWLLGGGSGHGFKHGPALAELVRDVLTGRREPLDRHRCGARTSGPALTLGVHEHAGGDSVA